MSGFSAFLPPEDREEYERRLAQAQAEAEAKAQARFNFLDTLDRDGLTAVVSLMNDVVTGNNPRLIANWYVGYANGQLSARFGVSPMTRKTLMETIEDLDAGGMV